MLKTYNVNFIEKDTLIITGEGRGKAWGNAEVLHDFVSPWDKKSPSKTEFRALWDAENLFFLFSVYDEEIHINKKDDSINSIGSSDRVEIFFRFDKNINPYYCLEIDSKARVMDFKAQPNKDFDFNWNWPKDDITVKPNVTSKGFTIEGSISLKSLTELKLLKNDKIEAGLFRAKYKKTNDSIYEPIWISWVDPNTNSPNFHTPSSFGILKLVSG